MAKRKNPRDPPVAQQEYTFGGKRYWEGEVYVPVSLAHSLLGHSNAKKKILHKIEKIKGDTFFGKYGANTGEYFFYPGNSQGLNRNSPKNVPMFSIRRRRQLFSQSAHHFELIT